MGYCAFGGRNRCRLFCIYGIAGMREFELDVYESKCKNCLSYLHCQWLCLSNETCLGEYFDERMVNDYDNEDAGMRPRKEAV